ncbi:MAG: hypothetical protein PWP31_1966 [Clostridia bacterium]|nr:hypothetical protein [Clostridia bacterium]
MGQNIKIVLAGEGGQGVQSIAEIISEAAYNSGFQSLYIPNFGVEQRGGVSVAFVQISDQSVDAPKFIIADIVIALSRRAIERVKPYIGEKTLLVYDSSVDDEVEKIYGKLGENRQLSIPALEMAQKEVHPRVFNIIILGVVVGVAELLEKKDVEQALERRLGHKFAQDSSLKNLNYRALELGYQLGQGK